MAARSNTRHRTFIVMAIAPAIGLVTWLVTAAISTPKPPSDHPLYAAMLFLLSFVLSVVDRRRGWLVAIPLLVSQLFGYAITSYTPSPPGGPIPGAVGVFLWLLVAAAWAGALRLLKIVVDILFGSPRQPEAGRCSNCGYNLTGNVSGVCPECGRKVDSAPVE